MLSHSKKISGWVKEVFTKAGKFVVAAAIFGQLPVIMNPIQDIQHQLHNWTGERLTFFAKLLQYINFIASCLVKPETKLNVKYLSYQLAPVSDLNPIGVVLLAVALIGFILNRQKTFARICISWLVYSFLILCIIGWGTNENGLILYTLYFFWAVLSLVFMAIDSVFCRVPAVKHILLGVIIAAILLVNIPGIMDLIQFGINYYYTSY
jgi:hypothetical protein